MLSSEQIERMLYLIDAPYSDTLEIDYVLEKLNLVMNLDGESRWTPEATYILDKGNLESTKSALLEFKGFEYVELFVNVYEVTRHLGGYEEGGWFYNHFEFLEGLPVVGYSRAESLKEELYNRYKYREYGDIYSVNSGVSIEVCIELDEAESETREIPFYE